MDPKVKGGLGAFESSELEQRCSNAATGRDVKPYRAPGGALQCPDHDRCESNGRACSRWNRRGPLMSSSARAAVSGEG
jgi:hypothetical protein